MTDRSSIVRLAACAAVSVTLVACQSKPFNPADGEAAQPEVVPAGDMSLVTVEKPDQFPLVAAEQYNAPAELNVTGSVFPDIAREVPAISLASGKVVDIKARLDDYVRKGDLLLKVQSPDITNAYDTYLKAVSDEQMTNKAYVRAKDLYAHGAIALQDLEQAEDAEIDNKADLTAATEQLNTLGIDKNDPHSIVPVYAPISGVIVAQNVTIAAAQGVNFSGNATAFTIADLSVVWIVCDVYENDIPKITLGQTAQIKTTAYPDRPIIGRVSDIGPILDPNIRTAKVRIEVPNPGFLKLGMFVTATFESKTKEAHAVVSTFAVLHLHDRDWVFVPAGNSRFRRVEVHAGNMLPGDRQELLSGINPGQQVVSNVLQLEATLEAQQ
ncbi:MAG: efflux RND transporter periplasmic adaptor subunit [Acidobacteriaceae bacterium]